jgi:hypothetical protein
VVEGVGGTGGLDPIIGPKARIKHGLAVVRLDYLYISLIIDLAGKLLRKDLEKFYY